MAPGPSRSDRQVEKSMGEQVLVIPREILFCNEATVFQGFREEATSPYLQMIAESALFLPREDVEEDPSYKQIIPYAVVSYSPETGGEEWFLMQRKKGGGEKRLHNLYSLGVGGHINPVDDEINEKIVERALLRELHEELFVPDSVEIAPIGLLNDDSNPVGAVHFGMVYKITAGERTVRVREHEQLEGAFTSVEDLGSRVDQMETWSRFVCEGLKVPG